MVQNLQTDLTREGYVKRGDLDDLKAEIITGLQTGQILIPQVQAEAPIYAGGTNHCPDSDLSYSKMAATVPATTPATVGDENHEAYRFYRQDKTGNVTVSPANALKALSHSLFAANEGANVDIPRWDRVNGWVEIGALGATQYDIAIQMLAKIIGPGQRWYVRLKLVALDAALVPADVQIFAGVWHKTSVPSEGWVTGGPFQLNHQVIGIAASQALEYRVLAKTDSGLSILSDVLPVANAPTTLSPENYIKLFYPAGPGFIEFQVFKRGGLTSTIQVTLANVVGGTVSAGKYTKTAAAGWGNAGFFSVESLTGDGEIEWTHTQAGTNQARMVGLSTADPNQSYTHIEFAMHSDMATGNLQIWESNNNRGSFGALVANTTKLLIRRTGTTITYYKDGVLLRTVSGVTTAPLFVDASAYNVGTSAGPITMRYPAAGSYSLVGVIRNSTDLQFNDIGQVGIPQSGWPADPGNAPKAYAQSTNVRIAPFGSPWGSNDLTIDIPSTYNFSQTLNDGQFLRIGLTAPPGVARHIGLDRIWFSTTYNAWAPDVIRLSDGSSPIPSIAPTEGNQGGGGPVIEPPPGGGGGGSCILATLPVLVVEGRSRKFKPFANTGVGDRVIGDIKIPYQVLRKRYATSSEYLAIQTKNGIQYHCNQEHRLLVNVEPRRYKRAEHLKVGDVIPAWVCGRIRLTVISSIDLVPRAVEVGTYVLRDMSGVLSDGQGIFVAGYSAKRDRGLMCSNVKNIDDPYEVGFS